MNVARLRVAGAALGAALAVFVACAPAGAASKTQPLEIDTASGPHIFDVELMSTDAERERGLMFRKSMAANHGMLFDFHDEQPVVFWMKDTLIPLDMIFVAANGRVVSIKHDARPMDRTLIPSGAPTLGVIELNAGMAEKIGVAVGDRVKNPIFHHAAAP